MQSNLPLADLVGHLLGRTQELADSARQDARQVADDARAFADSAALLVDSFRGTAAATPRMARILGTAASVGWLYQMDSARRRASGRNGGASESLHRRCAVQVRKLCEQLRGGALKVGQLASTRIDLLPAPWIEELGKLRDQAPATEFSAIQVRLEAELGAIDEHFASFSEDAMAAASLAQVHAATTMDGQDVAVKVQLPDIDKAVEADIKAMQLTARTMADSPWVADLPTMVRELSSALRAELDYRQEADNQRDFVNHYAADEGVIVPKVVAALSTERVLTMERIDGVPLDQYLLDATDTERLVLLEKLVDMTCEQVLRLGQLHADPHPGNFLVGDGGKVVLLDFGCVATFSPTVRRAYAELAMAALSGQRERVGALLLDMGFSTADGSPDGISNYADAVLAPFRDPQWLTQVALDPSQQLQMAIDLAREDPIVSVPGEFVLLARVFASLGGLIITYAPNLALGTILGRHLAAALAH